MPHGRAAPDDLTPDELAGLERHRQPFEAHWRADHLRAAIGELPDARWRYAAVAALVRVDLEQRWRRGEQPDLGEYLRTVPELGGAADLPAELILAEYQLRLCHGGAADLGEYAGRYPDQADELRRLAGGAALAGQCVVPAVPDTAVMPADEIRAKQIASGGDPAVSWPEPVPFGRYSLLRPLGRGGMGTVYLAHDPHLEREVALKIPSAELTDSPRASELMLREARAAAGLHHPNICPIYDVGVIDGVPYITSLYVEGEPLSAVAGRTPPIPTERAARLVATVAGALDYAHRSGIVHRDLKPSNVMLDQHGNPLVMDFGLARRVRPDRNSGASWAGLAGSPAYMAPEQIAESRVGPASDVYSLGVVLYELLTGRVPFAGTVAEVLQMAVSRPVPPPSKFRRGLDPALEAVCLKALAKQAADRYASMAEFAAALDAVGSDRRGRVRTIAAWLFGR